MKTDGTEKTAGAATPTESKNVPPKAQNKHVDTIGSMIERLKPQLEKALPKHITSERLARVALTAIRNNPKLQKCDALSLMGSIMVSAQLGLEPNTPLGQAYIIPYGSKANFQIGYKGLIDLALRSKQYRRINARAVDEADTFDFAYGLDEHLTHIPARKPTGNSIYFYAVYELDNGGKSFVVWSREQVMAHAEKYSKAYNTSDSPWKSAFDQMAKKTVLIDLLRYAPKSVELAKAAVSDNRTYSVNPDDPDLNLDTIDGDFEVEE